MQTNLHSGTKWFTTSTILFELDAAAIAQALFGWLG